MDNENRDSRGGRLSSSRSQSNLSLVENKAKMTFGQDTKIYVIEDNSTSFSQEKWTQILKDKFGFLDQALERATTLMMTFCNGVKDVHEYYATENNFKFDLPEIYFYESEEDAPEIFARTSNSMLVNIKKLRSICEERIDKKILFVRPKSEILSNYCTHIENFYQEGIEECCHEAFFSQHINYKKTDLDRARTSRFSLLAEYDAAEWEFAWLPIGRVLLEKKGMLNEAEILRQRHENALKVRSGKSYSERPFIGTNYPKRASIEKESGNDMLTWHTLSGDKFIINTQNKLKIFTGNGEARDITLEDFYDIQKAIAYSLSIEDTRELREFYNIHLLEAFVEFASST